MLEQEIFINGTLKKYLQTKFMDNYALAPHFYHHPST